MARQTVVVELDTKVLDNLIKHLNGNVEEAVNKTGFVVEGKAKLRAPVDTGALRASIYTSIKGRATTAMNKARSLRPDAGIVPLPTPDNNHTVYVGPSVEYGHLIELGESNRPARPYLLPAVREAERELMELLKKAVTP